MPCHPVFRLTLTMSVLPSCISVPPKILTVTKFAESVRPSLTIRSHRVWHIVCDAYILCGGYIYSSTHSSFVEKAIRTCLHFQYKFSEREPPTLVLRSRY